MRHDPLRQEFVRQAAEEEGQAHVGRLSAIARIALVIRRAAREIRGCDEKQPAQPGMPSSGDQKDPTTCQAGHPLVEVRRQLDVSIEEAEPTAVVSSFTALAPRFLARARLNGSSWTRTTSH